MVFTLQFLKLGPICAHFQKDSYRLGQNKKNDSPKALTSSKTAAPFISVMIISLLVFKMTVIRSLSDKIFKIWKNQILLVVNYANPNIYTAPNTGDKQKIYLIIFISIKKRLQKY